MKQGGDNFPLRWNWEWQAPPLSFYLAVALFVLFALFVERFATAGNLVNVARLAAILCIVSFGQATVLILGGIEFSFGSSVALASVVGVLAMVDYGVYAGLVACAGAALGVALVNAVLISRFKLQPFLVTLGTLMIAHGLAEMLVGGLPLDAPPSPTLEWPSRGTLFGMPVPVFIAALGVLVFYVVMNKTMLGRQFYLVGGNPEAARLAGIPLRKVLFLGYLFAGAFCAVGAVILMSRVGSGHANLWPGLAFETIAACAIGGIPLAGGKGRAFEVVCGVAIVAMMQNAVILLNLAAAYQQGIIAAVILVSGVFSHFGSAFPRARRITRFGWQQA